MVGRQEIRGIHEFLSLILESLFAGKDLLCGFEMGMENRVHSMVMTVWISILDAYLPWIFS